MITLEYLKYLFHYTPDTGVFTRLIDITKKYKAGTIAVSKKSDGYVRITVEGKSYPAHRLAWLYYYGVLPIIISNHINRIRDDNRIINLREVSRSQNAMNQNMYTSNTTGSKGVVYHKSTGKWQAQIGYKGEKIYIGLYPSLQEATAAYKEAAEILEDTR